MTGTFFHLGARFRQVLFLGWTLLLACATVPALAAPEPTILKFQGNEDALPITTYAQVFEDPTGRLELEQVVASKEGWQPGAPDALNFGFSKSVWWVRLRLENAGERRATMLMDLGNPRHDYVRWSLLRGSEAFKTEREIGDRFPHRQRSWPARNFAIPITMDAHSRAELVLRVRSYDGEFETMPLTLSRSENFIANATAENQLLALYHGGIAALALYNLLLWLVLREKTFGFYVLYLVCFSAWSFTFRGLSFQYLWPESPDFNNDFLTMSTSLTFATLGMFAIAYLKVRDFAPRWVWRLNQVMVMLNLFVLVPAFLGYYAIGDAIGLVMGLGMAVSTLWTAVWLLLRSSRPARFFVISFAAVAIGVFAFVLQAFGIIATSWLTTWGIMIGSAFQVLLLALGLADSMNELKAQKIDAERKAREAQEALNVQLAQQVNERTEALELANRRLHELAITDELTGAFNRSHFSAFCAAALTHRERDEPLAFCIFDIDHFKAYNEKNGLDAGNAVLKQVAQTVRGELRRSGDVLFRLGGEEFGILFTANSAAAAQQFIDRLRAAVRSLAIVHESEPGGVLTASFGVGWWDKSVTYRLSPNQIYAVADNMLYEAKEGGRDRVSLEAHSAPTEQPSQVA